MGDGACMTYPILKNTILWPLYLHVSTFVIAPMVVMVEMVSFTPLMTDFHYVHPHELLVGDTGQNGFDPIPIDISPYRKDRYSVDTIFRPHPWCHTPNYCQFSICFLAHVHILIH